MNKLIIATAALTMSMNVLAEDGNAPSYSYAGTNFGIIDLDYDPGINDLGFGSFYGSATITDNLHVNAGYTYIATEFELYNADYEQNNWAIGLGFHENITPTTSLYFDIGYTYLTQEWNGHSINELDDDALSMAVGIRSNISSTFELNAGLGVSSYDGEETGYLSGGLVYSFSSGFGLTLDTTINDMETTSIAAGIRYTF